MPLVIISGFPCCGKTTFTHRLVESLNAEGISKIKVINEESERIPKFDGYHDTPQEKKTRGALKSAVDHALDAECVVILDSMNYIKVKQDYAIRKLYYSDLVYVAPSFSCTRVFVTNCFAWQRHCGRLIVVYAWRAMTP